MNFVFHKQVCIWLHMVCRTIDGKCPEKKKKEEEECAVIELLSGAKNVIHYARVNAANNARVNRYRKLRVWSRVASLTSVIVNYEGYGTTCFGY